MNARQAKWIVEKLCPFILREQGRGFVMEGWLDNWSPGETVEYDCVERKVPTCGTVCCIGGSVQFLKGLDHSNSEQVGKIIGLTESETEGLCLYWTDHSSSENDYAWPQRFRREFASAKTTIAKARVAVRLLKLVAKTRGACLKNKWNQPA